MIGRFLEIFQEEVEDGVPILVVLAGHNGAGKSTFYKNRLKPFLGELAENHIDPDVIEKEVRQTIKGLTDLEYSKKAQAIAVEERERLLKLKEDVSFETVFSHESKLEILKIARTQGYCSVVIFVVLESPELSEARVANRVEQGGHPVPVGKIFNRYPRVLNNMREATKYADIMIVLDNSSEEEPFKEVALFHKRNLISWDNDSWVMNPEFLGDIE